MPNYVNLPPPPTLIGNKTGPEWTRWYSVLHKRLGEGPFLLRSYSKDNLPTVSDWGLSDTANSFISLIGVYDETSGHTVAFSDGTNWRRVQDRAVIS